MNIRRQGWANAVGCDYITRDGQIVHLTHYSVTESNGVIVGESDLFGNLDGGIRVEFDEQGSYRCGGPEGTEPPRL